MRQYLRHNFQDGGRRPQIGLEKPWAQIMRMVDKLLRQFETMGSFRLLVFTGDLSFQVAWCELDFVQQ